jgi:hypothetical protein
MCGGRVEMHNGNVLVKFKQPLNKLLGNCCHVTHFLVMTIKAKSISTTMDFEISIHCWVENIAE